MDKVSGMRAVVLAGAIVLAAGVAAGQAASGSVEGTVVDPAGSVVPGVLVTIEGPTPMAGARSDESGRFVLDAIPPGTYSLRLQVAGFESKEFKVQIDDGRRNSLGQIALELAPRLPCLGDFEKPVIHETKLDSPQKTRVSGTAREAGIALRKIVVRLRGPGTSGDVVSISTDENGRFQFEGVPPGRYDLLVPDMGVKLKVRMKGGRRVEIELVWKNPPAGSLCL
jgi:hypothetical protein